MFPLSDLRLVVGQLDFVGFVGAGLPAIGRIHRGQARSYNPQILPVRLLASTAGGRWVRCLALLLALLSGFGTVAAQEGQNLPGQALLGPHAEGSFAAAPASPRALPQRRWPESSRPAQVRLERLAESRLSQAMLAQPNKPGVPLKIGFSREVEPLASSAQTAAQLTWTSVPGGQLAALSLTSPDAYGVRLCLRIENLPARAILRFYAQGENRVVELSGQDILDSIARNLAAGEPRDEAMTYWSPLIDGTEITVEIELPLGEVPLGGAAEEVRFSIPHLSHLFASPLDTDALQEKIGEAASCQLDAMCYSSTWGNESLATARLVFTSSGGSYLCTGTLLSDSDSTTTIPYFLSAHHCISTQSEASSLETYWFYRATSCNSGALNSNMEDLTGGATLLYSNAATDTSFMRLNTMPPAGVWYAGWSASPQALNSTVGTIQHPRGDLQKIGFGSITGYAKCAVVSPDSAGYSCTPASASSADHLDVVWSQGTTQTGSSGSGLWAISGGSHYLVGQLNGGSSSCSARNATDQFGRFDMAYNAGLYRWLGAAASSNFALSVVRSGNGSGIVNSADGNIDCGTHCSANFSSGTRVTLNATPAPGSTFAGWSGACSGTGPCQIAIGATLSIGAVFTANTPVVEFYNSTLDHYFITANASETTAIDHGSAGAGWIRTGDVFSSGGSTPVCRFYGSLSPGPNSHFYTVSADECASLKALAAVTPASEKRWNFESLDFYSTPAAAGLCPSGTTPVFRAYNNGYARGIDSNHRVTRSTQAIREVVLRGWVNEGVAMCAPS